MSNKKSFNFIFFGSSEFVVPIFDSVNYYNGKSLGEIAKIQWLGMKEQNLAEFIHPRFYTTLSNEEFWDMPLLDKPIKLLGVLSQPDTIVRSKTIQNPVVEYAKNNKIRLFQPEKINKSFKEFEDFADGMTMGIVASYGQIISDKILGVSEYGYINWHPSHLPLYRGPTPIQSAIADGKEMTALTWIDMVKDVDAGDIYLQIQKKIKPEDNFNSMSKKLGDLGSHTWALAAAMKYLEQINYLQPTSVILDFSPNRQNHSEASFTSLITKEKSKVDFRTDTAKSIFDHYRAYIHYPGTWFRSDYFAQDVKLVGMPGWFTDLDFKALAKKATMIRKQLSWYQLKIDGRYRSFIKCVEGYLEVHVICLKSGKSIDLTGFEF